ncbi:vacuolar fusion protein ccz1 [Ophiostoma piceae UAMH 11346]|uniref:Vacuolar fusion protein ccz1 n=1 Tax=Ophiostoma piceae (strain UAMH 11346) TaxID=1262450 RepID=S3CAG3_OPHP1|nr:vacuolar fusion protein ccz1 [Ophiostoma piceae UAMH 11346]
MASFERPAAGGTADASTLAPAQLGFLAIYNPGLGTTDETVEDQIVYFASAPTSTTGPSGLGSHGSALDEERNERLRQIGLAQGMVAFGRSFAGDQSVDTIETDKARVILHELEPGWWILASIDLTRLPTPSGEVEYSSREVKPAALLLQDLLRAHSIFLLHHNITLQALFDSCPSRPRFTGLLARYWDVFVSSWSVLLHGNPVRDVLPGLRMAACGELGIGVGEEERGSGEREVLEGLVTQTEGLVDLVVCKYGELPLRKQSGGGGGDGDEDDVHGAMLSGDDDEGGVNESQKWLGTGSGLGAEDGAIFLGVGALSRPSLRSLTYWMEDVYSWGQDAYGIAENPSAPARHTKRRKKSVASPALGSIPEQEQKKKKSKQKKPVTPQEGMMPPPSLLPPPPVTQLTRRATSSTPPIPVPSRSKSNTSNAGEATSSSLSESAEGSGAMDKYMSIVKLGYGTYWSLGGGGVSHEAVSTGHNMAGASSPSGASKRTRFRNTSRSSGRFLIPLLDNAEGENKDKAATAVPETTADGETAAMKEMTATKPKESAAKDEPKPKPKAASPPRSVFVDVLASTPSDYRLALSQSTIRDFSKGASESQPDTITKGKQKEGEPETENGEDGDTLHAMRPEKLRVVVYAQRPFLYTFLFEQQPEDSSAATKAADMEKVVQILIDRQLSVLHKPLMKSTLYRPDKPSVASGASAMLSATMAASSPPTSSAKGSIYDLIWDPGMLTIHSTIPNIPEPYSVASMAEANFQTSANQGKRGSKTKQPAPPAPQQQTWSRVEALNTHMQILNMYAATRSNGAELERMCKTSRGWWIVWNRIVERAPSIGGKYGSTLYESDNEDNDSDDGEGGDNYRRAPSDSGSDNTATARPALGDYTVSKEIILIRKSSDHPDNANGGAGAASGGGLGGLLGSGSGPGLGGFSRASSAMRAFSASAYLGFGGGNDTGTSRDPTSARTATPARMDAAGVEELAAVAAERNGAGGAGWADGASKIAQGIGVDTKKYIEGLLTLNR